MEAGTLGIILHSWLLLHLQLNFIPKLHFSCGGGNCVFCEEEAELISSRSSSFFDFSKIFVIGVIFIKYL